MNTSNRNKNESILYDLGENLEYAKTYSRNHLELLKLNLMQELSQFAGVLLLVITLGVLGFILFTILTCAAVYFLAQALGSWILAFVALFIFILIIACILYVWRQNIYYNGVNKLMFNRSNNEINVDTIDDKMDQLKRQIDLAETKIQQGVVNISLPSMTNKATDSNLPSLMNNASSYMSIIELVMKIVSPNKIKWMKNISALMGLGK